MCRNVRFNRSKEKLLIFAVLFHKYFLKNVIGLVVCLEVWAVGRPEAGRGVATGGSWSRYPPSITSHYLLAYCCALALKVQTK